MPPTRKSTMPSAGHDTVTKKFWCDCTIQGCRTPSRSLNEVAGRTYFSHKKQQELFTLRARRKVVLQPTQPQVASDAQAVQFSDAGQFGEEIFSFGDTSQNNDNFFISFSQSGTSLSGNTKDSSEEDGRDGDDITEDEEAGSDFGDGVEPERIFDEERPVFGDEDEAEGEGEAQGSSVFAQSFVAVDVPAAAIYTGISRSFMILVVSLTAFFGLGRQGANMLLAFFGSVIQPLITEPGQTIPRQIGTVRQHLGLDPALVRYAVCPACEELSLVTLTCDENTHCLHCRELIYERKGKPKILFIYQPLTAWLQWLLQQPGVEDSLQEWREREPSSELRDVYDGSAWSDERDKHQRRFVDHSYSLMAALGIDWFSPLRSQYTSWHSTGAIMMTILNFPQRLRYHPSMTYLAGCTPGPKEPVATRLHCYLRPLIEELSELADGKYIPTLTKPNGQLVRLRIAFFCGDSVGRNKVCGFPPHSVKKGPYCGFCKVTISTTIPAFDRETRDLERCPQQQKLDSLRLNEPFRTKKARKAYERETGARQSPLNALPYWFSVDRAPVDHMHNVELGLIKRLFHRTLIEGKTLTASQLKRLQNSLLTAQVPPSEQAPDWRLGDPGGGSATAAHWSTLGRRLLVLLLYISWKPIIDSDGSVEFEPPASKAAAAATAEALVAAAAEATGNDEEDPTDDANTDPAEDDDGGSVHASNDKAARRLQARQVLRIVAVLAGAASLASRRALSTDEVADLDMLLRDYGRSTAALFGNKWVIYNTHIMTHIPQHIRRFGPPYHFSAYHFERMNGQLGKVHTNRHRNGEIEATYTKAFLTNARSALLLADSAEEIGSALQNHAPDFRPSQHLRLNQVSVVGRSGRVQLALSRGRSFSLPLKMHTQLYHHIRRTWDDMFPPLLSPSSSRSDGIRVLPNMEQHQSMQYGHLNFSSTGSRVNANKSRTYAAVDARDGALDLFRIESILSHSIHVGTRKHTTLLILGRRARRAQVPAFDAALSDARLQKTLKMFWTHKDSWGDEELLPADQLSSDAAFVHGADLTGVSPGEDQRKSL